MIPISVPALMAVDWWALGAVIAFRRRQRS